MGSHAKIIGKPQNEGDQESPHDLPGPWSSKSIKQLVGVDPMRPVYFVRKLVDVFGEHLIVYLFASQHLLKGFVMSMVGAPQPWIFRQKNVAGPRMQVLSAVVTLPWAMKPVIGVVSDFFAIGGYNKAPYIILTSCLGVAAMGMVGFSNIEHMSVEMLVGCFFMISLQCSTADLLSEAKYAEYEGTPYRRT